MLNLKTILKQTCKIALIITIMLSTSGGTHIKANDETLGYLFNKLETPIFYIDFKNALKNDEVNHWFKNRRICINCIGASYDKESNIPYIKKVNINDEFDGLIFIDETTSSKTPIYNLNKTIEPKQKCGTNDDEKISTIIYDLR